MELLLEGVPLPDNGEDQVELDNVTKGPRSSSSNRNEPEDLLARVRKVKRELYNGGRG